MKTGNMAKYFTSGAAGLAGVIGIAGCGNLNNIHGDCFKTPNFYYENREECEANGGDWGRWGLFPEERCNVKASDYGALCDSSCDCEGDCIAEGDLGYCSEHVSQLGCYSAFDEDGGVYEICKD